MPRRLIKRPEKVSGLISEQRSEDKDIDGEYTAYQKRAKVEDHHTDFTEQVMADLDEEDALNLSSTGNGVREQLLKLSTPYTNELTRRVQHGEINEDLSSLLTTYDAHSGGTESLRSDLFLDAYKTFVKSDNHDTSHIIPDKSAREEEMRKRLELEAHIVPEKDAKEQGVQLQALNVFSPAMIESFYGGRAHTLTHRILKVS